MLKVLQVKITGAGPPIREEPKMEPKDPQSSPSATPPPSPPSPPPPPPPSPASYTTPQSSPPDISPKRLPSVFDKKPKMKKEKKKKKKPPPPPPQPKPIERDPEECGDDVCGDGDGDLGQLPSIFAICYIPKTRQGDKYDDDERGYKEDRSGQASPRSDEEDDDPDIPAAVPSYMCPDEFASIFGKKIDARNLAEVGPHGWHPTANAPYDITDTGDTVTVGPSGWHEPRSE